MTAQNTCRHTIEAVPYRLELAQKLTVMKNVWELSRTDGPSPVTVGKISQARMKLKEHVTCTTPDGVAVVFTIKARSIIELGATYEIADGNGTPLATMTKDLRSSLGRSTYRIQAPTGNWTVTETNPTLAIIRRIVNIVSDIPWLLRIQFSILDENGAQIGHINRANMRIRDTYDIHVTDDRLDQRVAAAAGVAVDAFMNR